MLSRCTPSDVEDCAWHTVGKDGKNSENIGMGRGKKRGDSKIE